MLHSRLPSAARIFKMFCNPSTVDSCAQFSACASLNASCRLLSQAFSTNSNQESNVTIMTCRPIVLSGPSGGGKSTILNRAMKENPDSFAFSVSHTTRNPRAGEQHGVHYYFTTRDQIDNMIKSGEFLEHATFGGNTYGTSKKAVEDIEKQGKICVLDIELQGVRSIKNSHLNAKYILVRAPSIETLEARLRARGTETEESLQKRLKHAQEDLDAVAADPTLFDHVIVNDDLDSAYAKFINAIKDDLDRTKA